MIVVVRHDPDAIVMGVSEQASHQGFRCDALSNILIHDTLW